MDDDEEQTFLRRVNSSNTDLRATSSKICGSLSRETINSSSSAKRPSQDSILSRPKSPESPTHGKIQPSSSNRQPSPNNNNNDEEDEEDGAHDTITSLAGAQMLQKYRRNIAGSARPALNHHQRLEDLFTVEEPLIEEEKEFEQIVETEETTEPVFEPPDGGYGWFISLGAFIALFWAAGMIKSYGILFSEILLVFPDASVSLASWIPASMTTLALAMAPVASALCQKFNCRYVTLAGSLLSAIGIAVSSFASGVVYLFCSFGILTGIGVGLSTTPGIILTARYFTKRRALANMFCLSGTAAGSLFLPFFIEFLLSSYGFRGTVLILGACMLHVSISAALYRPLAVHVLIQKRESSRRDNAKATKKSQQQQHAHGLHHHHHHHHHHLHHLHHINHHHQQQQQQQHGHQPTPDVMAAKIQNKLNSLTDNADSISICSSGGSSTTTGHYPDISFFKTSMASLTAYSLPPESGLSKEDLYWPEPSPPTLPRTGRFLDVEESRESSASSEHLTLRKLYLHQIGSQLSLYKSYLLGQSGDVGERSKKERPKTNKKKNKMKGSLMFSLEDMVTDSTSILKDSRNPSLVDVRACPSSTSGKALGRSASCMTPQSKPTNISMIAKAKRQRRPRYYSEGDGDEEHTPSRFKLIKSQEPERQQQQQQQPQQQQEQQQEQQPPPPPAISTNLKTPEVSPGPKGIRKYLDIGIVADPLFMMMVMSVMAMSTGVPHVLFFLPAHARSVGFSHSTASYFLAINSAMDMIGRVAVTIIIDADVISKHICYGVSILTAGLSVMILPAVKLNFGLAAFVIGCYGFGSGAWFLMVPLLLADYLGVESIGSSYGLLRLFQSASNLIGPIVSGLLKDYSGSYVSAFLFMGSMMCLGATAAFFQPFFKRLSTQKKEVEKKETSPTLP